MSSPCLGGAVWFAMFSGNWSCLPRSTWRCQSCAVVSSPPWGDTSDRSSWITFNLFFNDTETFCAYVHYECAHSLEFPFAPRCLLQDILYILIQLKPLLLISGRSLNLTLFRLPALNRDSCCMEVMGWVLLRLTRFCSRHLETLNACYCIAPLVPSSSMPPVFGESSDLSGSCLPWCK